MVRFATNGSIASRYKFCRWLVLKFGGVITAIPPMFVMPNHRIPLYDREGNGMLGTATNLIQGWDIAVGEK
jgi:hypothetical protein